MQSWHKIPDQAAYKARTYFLMLGILLVGSPFIFCSVAEACECVEEVFNRGPVEALQNADATFLGTAIKVENENLNTFPTYKITFAVLDSWKGVPGKSVKVSTFVGGTACGLDIKKDETWLIFAYRTKEGNLTSSICTTSHRIEDWRTSEDVKVLDALIVIPD